MQLRFLVPEPVEWAKKRFLVRPSTSSGTNLVHASPVSIYTQLLFKFRFPTVILAPYRGTGQAMASRRRGSSGNPETKKTNIKIDRFLCFFWIPELIRNDKSELSQQVSIVDNIHPAMGVFVIE